MLLADIWRPSSVRGVESDESESGTSVKKTDGEDTIRYKTMALTDTLSGGEQGRGLPPTQAAGTTAGLVIGLAVAWVVFGPALTSAPIFAATTGTVLCTMVLAYQLTVRRFDIVFGLAIVTLALILSMGGQL